MSSNAKTRFICRVVRLRNALASKTDLTTGHVAGCPDCQSYYRASEGIEHALRRNAALARSPAPDDLAAKIALAVRQSAPRPRQSRVATWSMLAGATAAVALSFFVARQSFPAHPSQARKQPNAELHPDDVAKLVANVDALRIRLLDSVEPAATKLAAKNPLTQELRSVRADTRSALSFIALNFLPADSARQLAPGVDSTHS